MRAPRLVGGVTQFLEGAIETSWSSGDAHLSAMMNQFVGEVDPTILRNDLHQVTLNLLRCCLLCQLKTPREAHDVCINYDANGNSIPRSEHDIRCFTSNPGQAKNLVHRLRDLTAKLLYDRTGSSLNRLCLVAEEARCANEIFDLGKGSSGHRLWSRKRLEQGGE